VKSGLGTFSSHSPSLNSGVLAALQEQGIVLLSLQPQTEFPYLAAERRLEPERVPAVRSVEAKVPNLHGHQPQTLQASRGRIQSGEVQEGEVATKGFVAADALVVVQEIAAAVEDELVPIYLEAHRVVRGVAVHDVHSRGIDEHVGKGTLPGWDAVAPVAAPVE
jgi:hypothetical protein